MTNDTKRKEEANKRKRGEGNHQTGEEGGKEEREGKIKRMRKGMK